jgi:DnaK suppressor protein
MDSKFIETMRKRLVDEKTSLKKELETFATKAVAEDDYTTQFPQYGSDEGENAAEVAAYGDRLSFERTLEEQLADVESALQRMEDGSYGMCQYCKKPIEEQRLDIRPTSSSCVECKKKLKGE